MFQGSVLTNMQRPLKASMNYSLQSILAATAVVGGPYTKTISIPDTATVVRVYCSKFLRLGLEAPGTISTTSTFVLGATLMGSEWGAFALDNGLSRQLVLASTDANAVVNLEIY